MTRMRGECLERTTTACDFTTLSPYKKLYYSLFIYTFMSALTHTCRSSVKIYK